MPKVMVVDSDKNHGLLCRQELEDNGHNVLLCKDFNIANNLFGSFIPDIIVMEASFPSQNELRKCLKIMNKNVPRIIYTAGGLVNKKVASMADDFIIKTSDLSILTDRIGVILARKTANSEQVTINA